MWTTLSRMKSVVITIINLHYFKVNKRFACYYLLKYNEDFFIDYDYKKNLKRKTTNIDYS